MTKVLVVEDDKFLRDLIARKLISEGFEVEEAADGKEGVLKAKAADADIILLDLMLPGRDGFEVAEELRREWQAAPIPILVLTNLDQKEHIERVMELGAAGYLVKVNCTPADIVKKIREVLSK
ncbi:MAG: response regulator [Candidatus Yanofskybacteria bacterium]|nr:response regulator [Candidatus Yanofskybacteria bacterium]